MSSAGISTGNFRNSVVARIGRTPGQAVTELQTSTNMALASAAADSFPRTGTRRVLTPSGTGGFANTQTGIMRVTSAATHALLEELLSKPGKSLLCSRACVRKPSTVIGGRYSSAPPQLEPPPAAKAVIGSHDLATFERGGMEIPQEEWPAVAPLHSELLVEIAIIDFAAPADAEGVAAHEVRNRRGIKCLDQQLHVSVQFSAVPEPGGKPADGHVGDR